MAHRGRRDVEVNFLLQAMLSVQVAEVNLVIWPHTVVIVVPFGVNIRDDEASVFHRNVQQVETTRVQSGFYRGLVALHEVDVGNRRTLDTVERWDFISARFLLVGHLLGLFPWRSGAVFRCHGGLCDGLMWYRTWRGGARAGGCGGSAEQQGHDDERFCLFHASFLYWLLLSIVRSARQFVTLRMKFLVEKHAPMVLLRFRNRWS